jgi:hypothetical protein
VRPAWFSKPASVRARRLELALEQDVADHPPLAGHRVQRQQAGSRQLVAALVAVEAPEQLVPAADRQGGGTTLDRLGQRGAHGRERRRDQLLLTVLAATDVVEVVLARPDEVAGPERPHLELVPAPGRAARQHRNVAPVGVDVEVLRKEVADDDLHAAASQ